ncbi:aconitase X swivel domain-containing protein [Clostridium peptidivorans]|uniref:aconitase X swivel domain-containing protein n=1 Tax=Clostridium peptidivorans TaxID=100174 RepID=UPI000BE34131|nr:DUF126 domain-containing protein [Clostridium peptidivorans]
MSKEVFSCHKISEGVVEGEVLISTDDIMFYLIDPKTGICIEKGHSLEGKSVSKKILVFPGSKGSSVVQADGLYQLTLNDNAPKGMIIQNPETVIVASAIIIGTPMVDKVDPKFYEIVKDGDMVRVDTNTGEITLL